MGSTYGYLLSAHEISENPYDWNKFDANCTHKSQIFLQCLITTRVLRELTENRFAL